MISMLSVVLCLKIDVFPYWFVSDSNAILAVLTALCSFMYFKDVSIPYNKFINALGASTFGVLLIHANSDTMRTWLWRDTLSNVGYYAGSNIMLIVHSLISVILVYSLCTIIDWLRIKFLEKPFFSQCGEKIERIQIRLFGS